MTSRVNKFSNAKIVAISACVPNRARDVSSFSEIFSSEAISKIIRSTGIEEILTSNSLTAADLCYAAAKELFDQEAVHQDEVDTLIFVSQTGDYILPASSCMLQEKLGLSKDTAAFDISLGCSGYTYGLWVAMSAVSSGASKCVLLLVGDTISKLAHPSDKSVRPIFGDAGSATVIKYDSSVQATPFVVGTDGAGWNKLIVEQGGFRNPSDSHIESQISNHPGSLYMDGAAVFSFTLNVVPNLVADLHQAVSDCDISHYVFHQANEFMLRHLQRKIGIADEKFVVELKNFGNTSCASIPLAIAARSKNCAATVKGNVLLAGFGVGLSWAGCVVDLSDCKMSLVEAEA